MSSENVNEAIEEINGEETNSSKTGEEAIPGVHNPVSHTIEHPSEKPQIKAGEDENGDNGESSGSFSVSFEASDNSGESQFEAVDGWNESFLTEAADEEAGAEASMDAWYAEATEADQQEFFGFLAPLVPLLVKSVVPSLAGAAINNLPKVIGPILSRLGGGPRRAVQGKCRESSEEGIIDEASLEAMAQQLEVIIGRDDRVQIMNTNNVPWKRICHLQIESANGRRFLGSGALVGPRTIITAGHCVFMHSQGGWVRSITVTPGRNGNEKPFGYCKAIKLYSVEGWVKGRKREYDYAAILLPPNWLAKGQVSAFGFANLSDDKLLNKKLNMAGYPGDKPSGTIWYHGRNAKTATSNTLIYDIDSMGGQSGSPVWIKEDNKRIMVGIHTNGSPAGNSATRITRPVMENIKRWRKEGM